MTSNLFVGPVHIGIAVALGIMVFVILEVLMPLAKRAILDGSTDRSSSSELSVTVT